MEGRYDLEKKHKRSNDNITILMLIFGVVINPAALLIMFTTDDSNWTGIILGIVGICGLIFSVVLRIIDGDKRDAEIKKDTINKLNELKFNVNESLSNYGWSKSIRLDENEEKLYYATRTGIYGDYKCRTVNFDEILDVTISSNGVNQINVSKGGLIGGGLVGGALFGGVGAVIGALGANKTSTEEVHELSLKITVNDLTNPLINMDIISSENAMDSTSELYRSTINLLDEWFGKLTIVLKRNEKAQHENRYTV